MISQTAEYALRAIVHLATEPTTAQTTRQIAEKTGVPSPYLAKVMKSLARAGLVRPQRGLHGGFRLNRAPEAVSIYEVVQAVDPLTRIHTCPLGIAAHGTNLCPLHRRLDDAMALVEQAFKSSSLAELLAEPSASRPLCPFPLPPTP